MRRRKWLAGAGLVSLAQWLALGGVSPIARAAGPAPRRVPVVARRFVFLPSEIEVAVGEPIELSLTAADVVMGFYSPELNLRAVIVPGQPTSLRFAADRAGRFDFLCDIFCGDGHEGMNGHIIVTG